MSLTGVHSLILRTDRVGTVLHIRRPIIPTAFAEQDSVANRDEPRLFLPVRCVTSHSKRMKAVGIKLHGRIFNAPA